MKTLNGKKKHIDVPWGRDGRLEFDLPAEWKLIGGMAPAEILPHKSIDQSLDESLHNPVESRPLKVLARGKKRVVIVVDDISRPTPAHLLLGIILGHLSDAGVDLKNTFMIPGLGMHRAMTQEEMEQKAGVENLERVRWENPDCRDRRMLKYLGRTKRGTRIFINRKVAAADLVVVVGTIEPHVHAGFGGGFKNILPGVAGIDTISQNHAICAHPKYFSMLGVPPDENPMRRDIEEAGRMLKGDVFLVNTVLNAEGRIAAIVAGDPVAAHRLGVETASRIYGVRIPKLADVVITDSHPMDIDMRQGIKAVANTLFAAKPGGVIIAAMKCEEGLADVRVPRFKLKISDEAGKFVVKILSGIIPHLSIPGISEEERFAAYFLFRALLRNRIFIYAPSISEKLNREIPLIKFFDSMEKAVEAARKLKPAAEVLIFPNGGVTYPIVK